MQVPLLLRLNEDGRAMQRAVDSGDTDLVYLVLFSLFRRLPLKDFITAISSRPKVLHLFLSYCTQVVSSPEMTLCPRKIYNLNQILVDLKAYKKEQDTLLLL